MRRFLPMLLPVACHAAPAAYPDGAKVTSAEARWCQALAKYEHAEQESWRHTAECTAATPAGSAPFVSKMTDCYLKLHEGKDPPDLGAVVANCSEDVLANAPAQDLAANELVQARCARMKRCEQVEKSDCLAAFDHLDPMQKAALVSAYNLRTQHEIADCLDSSDCSSNEDQAREQCYAGPKGRRVWLPSL